MMNRVIPDPVYVYFPHSGILSVKTVASVSASEHPDLPREMGVQGRCPRVKCIFAVWDINVSHLSKRMNAGVRPSCSMQFYRLREHFEESALQMILYTVSIRLRLPPAERASVVRYG
jgi:hypothetical protein